MTRRRRGSTIWSSAWASGTTSAASPCATACLLATESRYPRDAFERDVARVLEYVAAGDVFQTVLSRRQEVRGAVDPLLLYPLPPRLNPAPYLFHLALDDFTLVGSSPEVLVRVEGSEVTVRPSPAPARAAARARRTRRSPRSCSATRRSAPST